MSNIIHKRVVGREDNSEYKYVYTYTSALNFSYLTRSSHSAKIAIINILTPIKKPSFFRILIFEIIFFLLL